MTAKIPGFTFGKINTEDVVQIGCVYCLAENLEAPASNHVAYMWNGTSMCASHFKSKVINAK